MIDLPSPNLSAGIEIVQDKRHPTREQLPDVRLAKLRKYGLFAGAASALVEAADNDDIARGNRKLSESPQGRRCVKHVTVPWTSRQPLDDRRSV